MFHGFFWNHLRFVANRLENKLWVVRVFLLTVPHKTSDNFCPIYKAIVLLKPFAHIL